MALAIFLVTEVIFFSKTKRFYVIFITDFEKLIEYINLIKLLLRCHFIHQPCDRTAPFVTFLSLMSCKKISLLDQILIV